MSPDGEIAVRIHQSLASLSRDIHLLLVGLVLALVLYATLGPGPRVLRMMTFVASMIVVMWPIVGRVE